MSTDMRLPEGFTPDEDGNYKGIPPWAMRMANQLMASTKQVREWDVPLIATALLNMYNNGGHND
jgi:hypothetical protein